MKIIYQEGNIVEVKESAIIHGCNAQGVMGSGVAFFIREYFPSAYKAYVNEHIATGLKLGSVIWVNSEKVKHVLKEEVPKQRWIGNCITQEFFGGDGKLYVDYGAMKTCFESAEAFCITNKIDSVAMPKIGAGLAGGDWDIISDLIETSFIHTQPVVYEIFLSTEF